MGGELVALKVLRANESYQHPSGLSDLVIPQTLRAALPPSVELQTVEDYFFVQGPNGLHWFLVIPFSGPNRSTIRDCPGRTTGSRRLRADLARKVAGQVAIALYHMHCVGVVHGGAF